MSEHVPEPTSPPDPAPEVPSGPLVRFDVVERPDGELLVSIAGELDISNLPRLASRVETALTGKPRRLVVDVAKVRFADSSAIAQWLQWSMAVPEFELRDPPVLLRAVISTMGLAEQLGMPA